jgi:hypothetical protein
MQKADVVDILTKMSEVDVESSNGDSTSHFFEAPKKENDEVKQMRDRIIKDEEIAVNKARLLVVGALVLCLAAVTSAIYVFARNGDQRSFELEVSNCTRKQASFS